MVNKPPNRLRTFEASNLRMVNTSKKGVQWLKAFLRFGWTKLNSHPRTLVEQNFQNFFLQPTWLAENYFPVICFENFATKKSKSFQTKLCQTFQVLESLMVISPAASDHLPSRVHGHASRSILQLLYLTYNVIELVLVKTLTIFGNKLTFREKQELISRVELNYIMFISPKKSFTYVTQHQEF